jgi:hypothetical protein
MRGHGDDGAGGTGGADGRSGGSAAVERVRAELAQLGVAESARDALARRLAPMIRGLSSEAYAAALAGVTLAHVHYREQEAALRRSLNDLGEIQRLLGAFGEELCRLDEALRMLSREGRSRAAPPPRSRLLH